MAPAIHFAHVFKSYKLGTGRESFREMIVNKTKRTTWRNAETNGNALLWALHDVSFDIEPGEAVGIVGSNGAGKTTALKLLSRVTSATHGDVETMGRIAALIELGAGFHPDLTGRENIYLNGAIMGLTRKEISRKFDRIVAFAELERFIDTPIKRYSSGMYARLGFSVAAHLEPDILLVDEVLSVGDAAFQQKCYDFIHEFVSSGRTTVFVSHNLFPLEQLCNRIVWLDHGKVVAIGDTHVVLSAYMDARDQRLGEAEPVGYTDSSALFLKRVFTADEHGFPKTRFFGGENICVHIDFYAAQSIEQPHFVIAVWDAVTVQPLFLASMLVDNSAPEQIFHRGHLICEFHAPPLLPRTYQIWGEVYSSDRKHLIVNWQPLTPFTIVEAAHSTEARGSLRHQRADAPIKVSYNWKVEADE